MSDEATVAPSGGVPSEPVSAVEEAKPAQSTEAAEAVEATDAPEGDASETGDDAADAGPKKPAQNSTRYWRRQAEKLSRQNDQLLSRFVLGEQPKPAGQQAESSATSVEPKQDDFQTYEEYVRAVARHEAVQEFKTLERQQAETRERERTAEARRTFEARIEQASERYANYDEVAGSVMTDPDFPMSQAMAQTVMESDKGPDLVYWLGSHPEEARRIAGMSPFSAARELGRIEASLNVPAKRNVTQAPPPPKTLKGGETPTKNPADMDMAEYVAWRNKGGGKAA